MGRHAARARVVRAGAGCLFLRRFVILGSVIVGLVIVGLGICGIVIGWLEDRAPGLCHSEEPR
jgi:hypothetical protein